MPDNKIKIGNVEVISLSDGRMESLVSDEFPSVAAEAWKPYREHVTVDGKVTMNWGSFLVRSDGKNFLVDTGLGTDPNGFEGAVRGLLIDEMSANGVAVGDIDVVLITHLHSDHVGWNFARDGDGYRLTFPNARYWVPRADWDLFTNPSGIDQYASQEAWINIKTQVVPLKESGRMEFLEGEQALTSELTAFPTPGHTPGQTSFLISSQGARGVITGDAVHVPAQFQEVGWSLSVDTHPKQSVASRHALIERIERDDSTIVMAGHFPAPGIGRLVQWEGSRHWRAL